MSRNERMPERKLIILLDEHYRNDVVAISADGQQIYRDENVNTKLTISLADQVEAQVFGDEVRLVVDVPTRGLKLERVVELAGEVTYLRVSVDDDQGLLVERIEHPDKLAFF